jgi:hypothetical protein
MTIAELMEEEAARLAERARAADLRPSRDVAGVLAAYEAYESADELRRLALRLRVAWKKLEDVQV